MTIKQYLILMTFCTVLCALGFLLILFFINPQTTSGLGFLLFYSSFFFALVGILALFSYGFRLLFTRQFSSKKENVQLSFRQAIFWSVVVTVALYLQANHLMSWFNSLLLVLLVTLIEFLIISLKKQEQAVEEMPFNQDDAAEAISASPAPISSAASRFSNEPAKTIKVASLTAPENIINDEAEIDGTQS